MKVHLLYPNRDFDHELEPQPENASLINDLELSTLFKAMAREDRFILDIVKKGILNELHDLSEIKYRQDVLSDCLEFPLVIKQLYQIPIQIMEIKRKNWLLLSSRNPTGLLRTSVKLLQSYLKLLGTLNQIATEFSEKFQSQGFKRFFQMIQTELSESYLTKMRMQLKELRFDKGILVSVKLGKGGEGTDYILRQRIEEDTPWVKRIFEKNNPSFSFNLHPRDDAGANALEALRNRALKQVAVSVAQSADHIDSFFAVLRRELAFYLGCINLAEKLEELNEPITFPRAVSSQEKRYEFQGLYDICLALTMQKTVVGNDIASKGKNLVMVTGPNQGGKSTFLRSLGLSQVMMQCGMFVPANSFVANISTGIFTHFKREEDGSMSSGKLDEELTRMSKIVDRVTPNSLILFNESFASTNEYEGSEIAFQIVKAMLEKNIKVIFVTHMYSLSHKLYEEEKDNILFLRAGRQADGKRTFRMNEEKPLATSFGKDLFEKMFSGKPSVLNQ